MKRLLFVGAPFGGFFRSIATELEHRGASVWRIVFEGGDLIETPHANRIVFKGSLDEWPAFVRSVMREKHISTVITFNDSCPRTRGAIEASRRARIPHYVIENGYLRPWWITFDRDGVNGNSILPRDPGFYLAQAAVRKPFAKFRYSFRSLVRDTIIHYAANALLSPILPYDSKYYGDSVMAQAAGYIGEYIWRRTHSEAGILRKLQAMHKSGERKIFMALMQKPGDAQLCLHSDYRANAPYLREVLASFAASADPHSILVVKQHPLDYGVEGSAALVSDLVHTHGLEGRVFYVRTLQIEKLLEICGGLVTVNSTGGFAALQSRVPTIALGTAIYDMERLTFQGGIDRFWTQSQPPDPEVFDAFYNYLTLKTQVNGGFHTRRARSILAGNFADVLMTGAWAPHHELSPAKQAAGSRPHLPLQPAAQAST